MKKIIKNKRPKKDWFRIKKYPHISLQLNYQSRRKIYSYIKDEQNITSHAFSPFIHRKLKVRKFRKEICHDGTRSKLRKPSEKIREIYYSNHLDSVIYSFYSDLLLKKYEDSVKARGINECVTAYRRISLYPNNRKSRNKCNIDFANDVFSYIKNSKTNLVVATFDFKSFFDNLDHKILKKYWRDIIDSGKDLPPDHYNIYRSLTKFSYIEEEELFNEYKDKILVERNPDIIKPKSIDKYKYLKSQRAIAYCLGREIHNIRSKGLIKANKYDKENKLRIKGIPQGSPISAILANIYMVEFDELINDKLISLNGIYRRYSDDMIIICKIEYQDQIQDLLTKAIDQLGLKLKIQEEKTQLFHFLYNAAENRHNCFEYNRKTSKLQNNTNFEYLGFEFDGYYTSLKKSSLANYYRKMKKSFAKSRFYTYHNRTTTKGKVFKNRLYKRFTHIGAKRRRVYQRDEKFTDRFIKTEKYDWGNYLSYAYMAARVIPNNKIKRQTRNHWKIFHQLLDEVENLEK